MKQYLHERASTGREGLLVGVILTAGVHLVIALFCAFTGLHYLYPPPPETTFLIEFEAEEVDPELAQTRGRQPQADEIDKEKPVDLVQQAQSPYQGERPNNTQASAPDPHGDVDVPTPENPKQELDPRASFPGMSENPSSQTTPHNATEGSDTFKAGESDGNTDKGKVSGAANAHVKGRNLIGSLKKPEYATQMEGKVVVRIKVDQYGNVIEALPGAEGTTVTDKGLWNAARKAAMEAHFNTDASAPAVQEGTITYIFKVVA